MTTFVTYRIYKLKTGFFSVPRLYAKFGTLDQARTAVRQHVKAGPGGGIFD